MAEIRWLNPLSGNFTNASDWAGGVVPGKADDAILDPAGVSFMVTSAADEKVHSVQLASNAILDIAGGTFTAAAGTGGGENAGSITVTGGGVLSLGGKVDNAGTITMVYEPGVGEGTLAAASDVTFAGGGVISGTLFVDAAAPGLTLTNLDDTITGGGYLFASSPTGTTFVNQARGVIDATTYTLDIGASCADLSLVNDGTIEATTRDIGVYDCSISGAGTIAAGAGSSILISGGGVISGQTLTTGAGGLIEADGTPVAYSGNLNNVGMVSVYNEPTPDTPIFVLLGSTTITGGGTIYLGGSVSGAGAILTNVDNTIISAVDLGDGEIGIVNLAGGTIEASTLIDSGAHGLTNAGLIETRGKGGVLAIAGVVANSGTIRSVRGVLTLDTALTNDGLLGAERGGLVTVDGAVDGTGSAKVVGGALDFAGAFNQAVLFEPQARHVGVLELSQSQAYSATVNGFSPNGATAFDLLDIGFVSAAEATFSGSKKGGVLTVTDGAHTAEIRLKGDYLSATFVASSDGRDGVTVVATSTPVAGFVSAMASLGAGAGEVVQGAGSTPFQPLLLTRPHAAAA